MTDLEGLHKIKQLLDEREYTKNRNREITEEWDAETNKLVASEKNRYENAEKNSSKAHIIRGIFVTILMWPLFLRIYQHFCSEVALLTDNPDAIKWFISFCAWCAIFTVLPICGALCGFSLNFAHAGLMIIAILSGIVYFFIFLQPVNFWEFLLATLALIFMPLFLLFRKLTWGFLLYTIYALLSAILFSLIVSIIPFILPDAIILSKNEKKKKEIYEKAFAEKRLTLRSKYAPLYLKDTTDSELQKLAYILPRDEHNYKIVNELIRYIERREARDIPHAKQIIRQKLEYEALVKETRAELDRMKKEQDARNVEVARIEKERLEEERKRRIESEKHTDSLRNMESELRWQSDQREYAKAALENLKNQH